MASTRSAALLLTFLASSGGQSLVTVHFDNLTQGVPVPVGSAYESLGVRFERLVALPAGPNPAFLPYWCFAPGSIPYSFPNVALLSSSPPFHSGSILVTFVQPGTGAPAVTDLVEWNMCDADVGTTLASVTLMDVFGSPLLVQSFVTPPTLTSHISLTTPGIASVLITTDQDDASMDDFAFHAVTPSALPGQANSTAALLWVNGFGSAAIAGPFTFGVGPGSTMYLTWSGPPNQPYILAAGPPNNGSVSLGCSGILHIGTPPAHSDLILLFNGTEPGLPAMLFQTSALGISSQSFVVPAFPPGSPPVTLQGAILQPPGSACPFVLTAAFNVLVY